MSPVAFAPPSLPDRGGSVSISWMPPGMDPAEKQDFADAYPTDPHAAAAAAWESWAATLTAEPSVASVSTGAQSISYLSGGSDFDVALQRAAWHRARARVSSVEVGGDYAYGWDHWALEGDQATYYSAPMPPTGSMQVNLPTGTVGPTD